MDKPMYKVEIITRPRMLETLKEALHQIGMTDLTVSQVLGCGTQKGTTKLHGHVPVDSHLLSKVKFEMIVCDIPVELIIETATRILRTGEIGDGKIFVYEVAKVVRIPTGEEDYKALQDHI